MVVALSMDEEGMRDCEQAENGSAQEGRARKAHWGSVGESEVEAKEWTGREEQAGRQKIQGAGKLGEV